MAYHSANRQRTTNRGKSVACFPTGAGLLIQLAIFAFLLIGFWSPFACAQLGTGADDSKVLGEARGHLNSGYLSRAKELLKRIADKSGPIGDEARSLLQTINTIEQDDSLYQDAQIAISRNQNDVACDKLLRIEASLSSLQDVYRRRYSDMTALKGKAGGCTPPVPSDIDLREQLENAQLSREDATIPPKGPNDTPPVPKNPDTATLPKNLPKLDKFLIAAEADLKKGNLDSAAQHLAEACRLGQEDPRVKRLVSQLKSAEDVEKNALLDLIKLFYQGKYEPAKQGLADFVAKPHHSGSRALGHFFLGATLASQFYLSGESDSQKKEEALQQFGNVLKINRDFAPQSNTISPKIMKLYEDAIKRQKSPGQSK